MDSPRMLFCVEFFISLFDLFDRTGDKDNANFTNIIKYNLEFRKINIRPIIKRIGQIGTSNAAPTWNGAA